MEAPLVFQRTKVTSRSPGLDDPYNMYIILAMKVRVLYPDGKTDIFGEHVTIHSDELGSEPSKHMGWVELNKWSEELKKKIQKEHDESRQDDTDSGFDRIRQNELPEEPAIRKYYIHKRGQEDATVQEPELVQERSTGEHTAINQRYGRSRGR